jgi:tetratricopeptide (TPR) repeat protein
MYGLKNPTLKFFIQFFLSIKYFLSVNYLYCLSLDNLMEEVLGREMEKKVREIFSRGEAFFKSGMYKEALSSFQKIDLDVLYSFDRSLVYHFMGMCYAHMQEYQKSLHNFELAVEHNPHNALINYHFGLTYYFFHNESIDVKRDRLLKSAEQLEAALVKHPTHADSWYYHGVVCEKLDNILAARESFKRALRFRKNTINKEGSVVFEKVRKERLH